MATRPPRLPGPGYPRRRRPRSPPRPTSPPGAPSFFLAQISPPEAPTLSLTPDVTPWRPELLLGPNIPAGGIPRSPSTRTSPHGAQASSWPQYPRRRRPTPSPNPNVTQWRPGFFLAQISPPEASLPSGRPTGRRRHAPAPAHRAAQIVARAFDQHPAEPSRKSSPRKPCAWVAPATPFHQAEASPDPSGRSSANQSPR